MKNYGIITLLMLSLILLGSHHGQSQVSSASKKKTNHIGFYFMTPMASGNVQPTEALLLPGNRNILTDHYIKNGIGISYSTTIPTKTLLVSSVEGGFNLRYLAGSTTYERINEFISTTTADQFAISRTQRNFQNVFVGTSVKLRRSLLPSKRLELVYGIDINGRIWNKLSSKTDIFLLDTSTETPTTTAIDEPSSFRSIDLDQNLIFVQVNVAGGFSVNQFLDKKLSLEVLFNYSALQIHNHGNLKVNPIFIGLKYQL